MAINSGHITGFVIGLGVAAGGFVVYKQNQEKVDTFLRSKGINMPGSSSDDSSGMSLEELISKKEQLEDLIAEREYAARQAQKEADKEKS